MHKNVIKKLTALLFPAVLFVTTGCATIQDAKKPENRTTLELANDYQTVYGIVVRNSIACSSPEQIHAILYPDTKTGQVTDSHQGIVAYTLDIRQIDAGRTAVDVYTSFVAQRDFVPGRIKAWVQDASKSCKFNGKPFFGPDQIN